MLLAGPPPLGKGPRGATSGPQTRRRRRRASGVVRRPPGVLGGTRGPSEAVENLRRPPRRLSKALKSFRRPSKALDALSEVWCLGGSPRKPAESFLRCGVWFRGPPSALQKPSMASEGPLKQSLRGPSTRVLRRLSRGWPPIRVWRVIEGFRRALGGHRRLLKGIRRSSETIRTIPHTSERIPRASEEGLRRPSGGFREGLEGRRGPPKAFKGFREPPGASKGLRRAFEGSPEASEKAQVLRNQCPARVAVFLLGAYWSPKFHRNPNYVEIENHQPANHFYLNPPPSLTDLSRRSGARALQMIRRGPQSD